MSLLLTRRRRQFLRKLIDLHSTTKLPIHYEAVASALGVSKWTAYDMLRALEKAELLERSYAAPGRGDGGRSQVLFVPTARAEELVRAEAEERSAAGSEDWAATKAAVLKLLGAMRSGCGGNGEPLQRLSADIKGVKRGADFCAYLTAILLAYLRKAGGRSEEYVRHAVRRAPTGEMGMTVFAGAVLGAACETMAETGAELAELAAKYLKSVAALTDREKQLMSDFLLEALV